VIGVSTHSCKSGSTVVGIGSETVLPDGHVNLHAVVAYPTYLTVRHSRSTALAALEDLMSRLRPFNRNAGAFHPYPDLDAF
jgi:hypothetical protein